MTVADGARRGRDLILVVDDSPETLSLLTDSLEAAGGAVLVAVDGTQALAIAEKVTPDIILLDAVMPGLDGFETCRRMKLQPALAHVPVIFMTGLSDTEHIVRGLEAGGVDYVTKPIDIDELQARIRVHLVNARAAQSARLALDTAGRYLLAADGTGRVRWSTPQARRLLGGILPSSDGEVSLPDAVRKAMREGAERGEIGRTLLSGPKGQTVEFSFLGRVGSDEFLFRLTTDDAGEQSALLKQHYGLTSREAEVLVWVARGKSNRDVADILSLSPRTVNKHLEQVFAKLGVENRASAAALAFRALGN